MGLPQNRQMPPTGGSAPQVAELAAEVAATLAYLEALSVPLRADEVPGQSGAAAIPSSTLVELRRSCQRVARCSDLALTAISPRRAAAVRLAAEKIRDVETLRFEGRARTRERRWP